MVTIPMNPGASIGATIYKCVLNSLGHSLHNDFHGSKQIVDKTKEIFNQ